MLNLIVLYVYYLCFAVFFGSSVFIGFVAAPAIFKTLATKDEAGNLVGLLLDKFSVITYVLQLVLVIIGLILFIRFDYSVVLVILPFAIILINGISSVGISIPMKKLKIAMGNIDNTPKTDKNRVMFNNLHKWSVRLFILNQFLALFIFYYLLKH